MVVVGDSHSLQVAHRAMLWWEYLTAPLLSQNSIYLNGEAEVVMGDIVGMNGVIHFINKILIPSDLVDRNISLKISQASLKEHALISATAKTGLLPVFLPTALILLSLISHFPASSAHGHAWFSSFLLLAT